MLAQTSKDLIQATRGIEMQLSSRAKGDQSDIATTQDRELHGFLECTNTTLCKSALYHKRSTPTKKKKKGQKQQRNNTLNAQKGDREREREKVSNNKLDEHDHQ